MKRVCGNFFRQLHDNHPDWTIEDLFQHLDLPYTALLSDLAHHAGFASCREPRPEQVAKVLTLYARGIHHEHVIAGETGLSIDLVRQVFELSRLACNGMAQMAITHASRRVSDGRMSVARRVTKAGQFSYKGCLYTLGTAYRGRTAMVIENGHDLHISFRDRPMVKLPLRQPQVMAAAAR